MDFDSFILPLKDYIVLQFTENDFFSGAFLTGVVIALVAFFRSKIGYLYAFFLSKYTVAVNINSTDESFPHFQRWLYDQGFDKTFKRFSIISKYASAVDAPLCEAADTDDDGDEMETQKLSLVPYEGTYLFKYKNKRILLQYEIKEPTLSQGQLIVFQTISLKFLGRDMKIIESIITEIEKDLNIKPKQNVKIFTQNYDYWNSKQSIRKRKLSTVILKENLRDSIIEDITRFISMENIYAERGIPYHRSFLFHGVAGAGKTSLIYAIASHFNKDIYFLSLTKTLKSEQLINLMSNIKENSLVVLEDIDVMFKGDTATRKMEDNMELSFSTLINVIDGFCSKHGTLLFMTTNKREILDPALVRPGRVDLEIQFENCDSFQIEQLTDNFFPDKDLGKKASEIIPEYTVSPAAIQGHYIKHIDKPENAILTLNDIMEKKA